jgi:DNA-binding GntR family transcriptional regulator
LNGADESGTTGPRRVGLVETLAAELREGIKAGRLVPGYRLVEADLQRDFGVSRGPIREALSRLEAEGLVEIVPNRGALVRRMTPRDIRDLVAARELIEGGAAESAARAAAGSRAAATLAAESRQWAVTRDAVGFQRASERFHTMLMELSGNRLLVNIAAQLQVQAYWALFGHEIVTVERCRLSGGEHAAIAEAILAGDEDAAQTLMRSHIRRTGDLVIGRLEQQTTTTIADRQRPPM